MVPDAHLHLDQLADPDRAIEEAAADGVAPLLAVSMDADAAEAILRLRDRRARCVLAGIGLHPSRVVELAPRVREEHLRRLEAMLPEADFVGEIGLDHKDALVPQARAEQREALDRQLAWAEARRLPVNLHSRRADREVVEAAIAFHERTGLGALMHWFTHSAKLARRCAEAGVFVSAGPSVLIDPRTAATAALIARTSLLVETDSPVVYGAEGPARPAWARRVAARLAELRSEAIGDLEEALASNLDRYLPYRRSKEQTRAPGL